MVCSDAIVVLGHKCNHEGWKPTEDTIGVIMRWTKCESLYDVRSFLDITGVLRSYIPSYGIQAQGLQELTKEDIKFVLETK